jgi:DNA-binding winged helix-turn-helix (wHTH) protein/tetratricopeptide (TPR) repeat protein
MSFVHKIEFPPYRILSDADVLYRGEQVVQVEPRAVQVLRYLAEHHDRVVSKEELLDNVWPDVFTTDAVLKKAVLQARRSLSDDANNARFIETHHGCGYRFVAQVSITPVNAETPQPCLPVFTGPLQGLSLESTRYKTATYPDYDQLVGREAELQALRAEYISTVKGAGRPVLITGEAGIGKTQLARYFAQWAREQRAVCAYARFFDYRGCRLATYEVFLDLLRAVVRTSNASKSADQLDLRTLVKQTLLVDLPEELFSEPRTESSSPRVQSSEGDQFRAIVPISKCFARLSRISPFVLILDDLQWADEASLELIGYLMRTAQREPLMLVGLIRADEADICDSRLGNWLRQQASYRSYSVVSLKPLSEDACRTAIGAIYGEDPDNLQLPARDLQTLHQLTGGNPYFLTEMCRLLAADGVITCGADQPPRWNGIQDLRLPETLVMAARTKLDRFCDEIRDLLDQASVIGDEFRVDTLSLMASKSEDAIEGLLREAVSSGVLSERVLSAGEDWRFGHTLLRRVLYDGLSPRRRKRLHLQAAQAIEIVYARESDRVAGVLSSHYEAGGDALQTLNWSMRAWQAARSRWSWNEAVISIERAHRAARDVDGVDHNQLSTEDRFKLMFGLSESYCAVGKLKESEAILGQAMSLAQELGDQRSLAEALLQKGLTKTGLGLNREAVNATEAALEIYRELGDEPGTNLALVQLGTTRVAMGEYEGAAQLIQQSITRMEMDTYIAARALGVVGWARVLQGSYAEGVPMLEHALGYHTRVGDVRQQAQTLRRLHWAYLSKGRYEGAIRLANHARAHFRAAGDVDGEAKMNLGIGQARIGQGLLEEGIELLSRTLEKFRLIGDTHCEAESLWLLGRAHSECGRFEEAGLLLLGSLEIVQQVSDRDDEFRVLTDIARLKIGQQEYLAGLGAADQAIEIAEELQNRDGIGFALVERARAYLNLNRPQKALEAAERAVMLLDETESGERWRAYWTLATVLDQVTEKRALRNKDRALQALRRSIELLREVRDEIDESDRRRREGVTRARSGPAGDLQKLLLRLDSKTEADDITSEWLLDEPLTKSGQLRLVKLPKAI